MIEVLPSWLNCCMLLLFTATVDVLILFLTSAWLIMTMFLPHPLFCLPGTCSATSGFDTLLYLTMFLTTHLLAWVRGENQRISSTLKPDEPAPNGLQCIPLLHQDVGSDQGF